MDHVMTEAIEFEFHAINMNGENALVLSRSWMLQIDSLREQRDLSHDRYKQFSGPPF